MVDLTQGINTVMLCFLAVGGADYLLGGRFGLGKEFEEGILTCGRLLLVMAGFMVLAPLIARGLGPVVSPLFRALGVDPSILAGMLLANDSGGLPLALELADTREAGLFSGLVVGSMLGTTVMLGIPTVMMFATQAERPAVIYGLLCGLVTIPLGCLVGGFAAGFSAELVLRNTVPVLVLSLVLLMLLLLLKERIVPAFSASGKLMTAISILGLVCGAADLERVDGALLAGVRRGQFSCEALVRDRESFSRSYPRLQVERVSLDDIMVFMNRRDKA